MLITLALATLLFSSVFASDFMRATFLRADSGVNGTVQVEDSQITMNLNLTKIIKGNNLPSGCNTTQGFLYHVHTSWHNINNKSHFGAHCNSTFVGGHYDPYGACSAKTGNIHCKVKGGCINTTYSCKGNYGSNPYACEVGDWSGKYGNVHLTNSFFLTTTQSSFGDITGNQLVSKSLVFHCANNLQPAFCAPFLPAPGTVGTSSRKQTNGYTLKADFSTAPGANSKKNTYIKIDQTGSVSYQFDTRSLTFAGLCSSGLAYVWIGDQWTDGTRFAQAGNACNATMYGKYYDPTNQCYASVNQTDCQFCQKGKLCKNATYSYGCSYSSNPFSCSPMDFSGRYGVVNITLVQKKGQSVSTTDRYLADLSHLVHKAVVLLCTTNLQPLACARFQNVGIGFAQATFSNGNTGAQGNIFVQDGQVTVQVGFSTARKYYTNGTLPPTCFSAGLKLHIHEKWTYSDTNDRLGATACGSTYTGGHWDPWAACSASSASTSICKKSGTTTTGSPSTACIAIGGSYGIGKYKCNSTNFLSNPFSCEVGDWSGKYGIYTLPNSSQVTRSDHHFLEVDATELVGRSVVFHCANDDTRAFCAPFVLLNGYTDGDDTPPTWALKEESGNLIYNASVSSSSWGMINLLNTGFYYVNINYASSPCSSGTKIGYGVFKDSQCKHMYDPTIQCIPNSEYNGTLCTNEETCNTAAYGCQFSSSPYSCSPSDLSGKYGATSTGTTKVLSTEGYDDLMVPLFQLRTRYFGMYCMDTWSTMQCLPWTVDVQATKNPTTSPTKKPTKHPTKPPTKKPTKHPTTKFPTKLPSKRPSKRPTKSPTFSPTRAPTHSPTFAPTRNPTKPTHNPTRLPTTIPTKPPTHSPSHFPTTTTKLAEKSSPIVAVTVFAWCVMMAGLLWI